MITTLKIISNFTLKSNQFVLKSNVYSLKCLRNLNLIFDRQISCLNRLTFTHKKSLILLNYSSNVLKSEQSMVKPNHWPNNYPLIEKLSTINPNMDSEKVEKEKQKLKQQKITKYTLLVMVCMFCGSTLYALLEWGKPSIDADGNVIEDRFSCLPLVVQYVYRAWDTLTHYEQVLREPTRELLLPPPLQPPYYQPPFTLVLEMTGVLVNPEWTYRTGWRFKKRPFVDYFLQQLATSGNFEIVIYTYEQGFTAFPLIDSLDPNGYVMYRLFRDSTRYENGIHLKDLNCLNRDLKKVIHIDWNDSACHLNKSNSLTLKKWDGNSEDRTLYDLTHFLSAIATQGVEDVRQVIDHYSQFDDPIEAFKENQRKLAQQQSEAQPKPPPLSTSLLGSFFKR